MRLFVAVDVSDEVRAHAEAVRAAWCRRVPRLARELRWVGAGQMHVTLRFIGEVDERVGSALARSLGEPLPQAPFDIEPGEPGWLPSANRPRVLILGFRVGGDEFRLLHEVVDERVRAQVTVEPEQRAFLPHLTLARARDPRRFRPVAAADTLAAPIERARPTARVDHVTLYESHLSPQGPSYAALARGRLAGTP